MNRISRMVHAGPASRAMLIPVLPLLGFALISLMSPLLMNSKPLLVFWKGSLIVPIISEYSPEHFQSSQNGRLDYRKLQKELQEIGKPAKFLWPLIPFGPDETVSDLSDPPPNSPSLDHPFGTDDRGRDCLVRLVLGFRNSLFFGLLVGIFACSFGVIIGAAQGFFGGRVDFWIQRLIEVWESLPFFFVVLFFVAIFPQRSPLILALIYSLVTWTSIAGYVRAEALRVRHTDYVMASKAIGATPRRILLRHVIPNSLTPALTEIPFLIAHGMTLLAALDFLGLGLPPPTPSIGELLEQARHHLDSWWLLVFPSAALCVTLYLLQASGTAFQNKLSGRIGR